MVLYMFENRIKDVFFGVAMSKQTSAVMRDQSADYELGYALGKRGFEVSVSENGNIKLVYENKVSTVYEMKIELSCFSLSNVYDDIYEVDCYASVSGYSESCSGFEHSIRYNADMLLKEVPMLMGTLRKLI